MFERRSGARYGAIEPGSRSAGPSACGGPVLLRRCAAALALLAAVAAHGPLPAEAQTGLYYELSAEAAPWYATVTREGYLLDPVMTGNVLPTAVQLSSTGSRLGTASLFDVGGAGEAPALLPLVVPSLPAIPYPGYPLTARSNYPAKPEGRVGFGSAPVTDPEDLDRAPLAGGGGYAETRSFEQGSRAVAYGGELAAFNGVVRVGQARSRTESREEGGVVKGTATAVLNQVDIAGVVRIDTVLSRTEVEAKESGSLSRTTVTVQGVKALGADAVIDERGVRIVAVPGSAPPQLPEQSVADLNKQLATVLEQSKLTIKLLPTAEGKAPADAATVARSGGGALLVSYPFLPPPGIEVPQNPIPGFPVGPPVGGGIPTIVTMVLTRTSASAVSGPGVESLFGADGESSGEFGGPGTGGSTNSAGDTFSSGDAADLGGLQGGTEEGSIAPEPLSNTAPAASDGPYGVGNDLVPGQAGSPIEPPGPSETAAAPAETGLGSPAGTAQAAQGAQAAQTAVPTADMQQAFWWVLVLGLAAGGFAALQIRRLVRFSGISLQRWLA